VPAGAPRPRLLVEDEQVILARAERGHPIFSTVHRQADGVLVEGG
jgi:hypothetical protein